MGPFSCSIAFRVVNRLLPEAATSLFVGPNMSFLSLSLIRHKEIRLYHLERGVGIGYGDVGAGGRVHLDRV